VVRDSHAWAHYITETLALWADDIDVVLASHHWPTWGNARCVEYLATQRDLYLYLHDQTLRMINQGLVGSEIAETLELPPALVAAWHTHGYYGSISHNVKAIYQRYLGWYEGNPARLWPHPPTGSAQRYVAAIGGVDAVVEHAHRAFDDGDHRWAAQLLDHALFAQPDHADARALQASAFEQLAYATENGTWRSSYLAGAKELREGPFGTPVSAASGDLLGALTVPQVFDSLAVRIDGPRAWDHHLTICWEFTDDGATYVTELRNGALNHRTAGTPPAGCTTFRLTRPALVGLVTGRLDLSAALGDGTVEVAGDAADLGRLVSLLAPVDPDFAIVTP
jgi:alkyl sulfatase BDS1-like metallo-beta-lactamase superfamily hydrolase